MNTQDNRYKSNVDVHVKNNGGYNVIFDAVNHYDASGLLSDTVDLPTPGRVYVADAGVVNILPVNGTTALPYTVSGPTFLPVIAKRIYSTSTTSTIIYILN